MDEIEYKLNTHNSVLVVNAIDKLISAIKAKFKPAERQKFVLENEELKFLREKCSAKDAMVSLTACQGLLALVELGVLEIGHSMSTIVTLLPSAHNYSAIISTMAGLLILDLKSRLMPGQPYTCQFSLRSPQHPFITILEKNKGTENDIIAQMHALCTHPDYTISSNSLELLRSVFLWLASDSASQCIGAQPWQLLLSLPPSKQLESLLLACISCQQIWNPSQIERAFAAYSAVTEAAIYRQNRELVMALLPMLARISNALVTYSRDPRACYSLIERCFAIDAPELRCVAGTVVTLLAENISASSALYLHELFILCLNILSKYEYSSLSLGVFASLSLQWLHLPSYLTSSALKVAAKILDMYREDQKDDNRLHIANLKTNKTFQALLHTDSHLCNMIRLTHTWERIRDNPDKLKSWLDSLAITNNTVKLELLPLFIGITMEKRKDSWYEEIVLKSLKILIDLVDVKKEISVQLLPILLYKIANDKSPNVKMECLKALPLMAKTKENVPTIVSVLNKLKANKGAPLSFLIMLYTRLAETQVRCFPYLQESLVDPGPGRHDDLKWETEIARAMAVKRICDLRPSSHGIELVSVISSILNAGGSPVAASLVLEALATLWRAAAVAPASTWRALSHKLPNRTSLHASICKLLSEVPALRVSTPEYDALVSDACQFLWRLVAESNDPQVVEAACAALSGFKLEDYKLADIPEIYRRTVKLPASYCKTPADAARKPEDVLDYIPCEIWPEVYRYTNQSALSGIQKLVSKLVEREVKSYRSGVYQPDARVEPKDGTYLPPHSVVRGVFEGFRKLATVPTYEFPEAALLAMLTTLTLEYPKPLPPMDLCFLLEVFHRGPEWKHACIRLCAKQANVCGSARRLLENYLQGVMETAEESDVLLIFELLPVVSRALPPSSLRAPVEKCLGEAYADVAHVKARHGKKDKHPDTDTEHLFTKLLRLLRACLECDKIHDANRTVLSQIVETYFQILSVDHVSWPAYVQLCTSLSTTYLERMTSPSSWWEVTSRTLKAACDVRSAVCVACDTDSPLVWLNEIIDCHQEQEYSLRCMLPALRAAKPDAASTKDWFLQLMARTQVAFKETEDESVKLYLCDVFMLSAIVFSGHWSFEPDVLNLVTQRGLRQDYAPHALASLMCAPVWDQCALQTLEWVFHTSATISDAAMALACGRTLLAARHTAPFVKHHMWKRLLEFCDKEKAKVVTTVPPSIGYSVYAGIGVTTVT